MKRFVRIFLLPLALVLGHVLVYNPGREYMHSRALGVCESYFNAISSESELADSPSVDFVDGYIFRSRTNNSLQSKHRESEGQLLQSTFSKPLKTVAHGDGVDILKNGKYLNINTINDFLNTLSRHTSGVRASVDRLFTLGSVRC